MPDILAKASVFVQMDDALKSLMGQDPVKHTAATYRAIVAGKDFVVSNLQVLDLIESNPFSPCTVQSDLLGTLTEMADVILPGGISEDPEDTPDVATEEEQVRVHVFLFFLICGLSMMTFANF